MAIPLGPTSTARPKTVSCASTATPTGTISAISTFPPRCAALRRRAPRGRSVRRAADRHPEEHRLRLRQGEGRRGDRGLRADPRRHSSPARPGADGARIEIEEYGWDRIPVDGRPHDQLRSCAAAGGAHYRGNTRATADRACTWCPASRIWCCSSRPARSSTASSRTSTPPWRRPHDRVMATSLVARWRYNPGLAGEAIDWDKSFDSVRAILLRQFADAHSYALQQTLYSMGRAVLEKHRDVAEIRLLRAEQAPLPLRPGALRPGQPRRGVLRRRPARTG